MRLTRLTAAALALLALALASGCQLIDQDRVRDEHTETQPWNGRAGWEDSSIGAPF